MEGVACFEALLLLLTVVQKTIVAEAFQQSCNARFVFLARDGFGSCRAKLGQCSPDRGDSALCLVGGAARALAGASGADVQENANLFDLLGSRYREGEMIIDASGTLVTRVVCSPRRATYSVMMRLYSATSRSIKSWEAGLLSPGTSSLSCA